MPQRMVIELELPDDFANFRMPPALQQHLQKLLDRQDHGEPLSSVDRQLAEGLVSLAEMLTLLRLRAERTASQQRKRT